MKAIARRASTAAGVLAALASTAWSQSIAPTPAPATQPQAETQERRDDRDGRPGPRGPGERRLDGRFPADGMRPPPPPRMEWRRGGDARSENFVEATPEEWKAIEAFMNTHSPERLKRLEDIGDEQRQRGVKDMFTIRYRAMQELKEQDPELYEIRLKRMPIEDKVFELGWRLTHKQSDKPDETKSQLRAQLRLLVRNRLDERALHLRHMEKRLKADEQRIDELVEANLTDLAEDQLPRDLRPPQFNPRRERRRDDDDDNSNSVPASPAGEQ